MTIRRSADDAPRDYPVYHSLEDAQQQEARRQAAQRQEAVVRHRAEPAGTPIIDAYGTRARRSYQRTDELVTPRTGYNADMPTPLAPTRPVVRRVADDQPIAPAGAQRRRAERQPSMPVKPQQPPQNAPMPEWYRAAQAAQMPYPKQPQQPPQPSRQRRTAPPQVDAYGQPFDRPYQVVKERVPYDPPEEQPEPPRTRLPWAAILIAVLVLASVELWIAGTNYERERISAVEQREQAQRELLSRYTLEYRELIDREAVAYNVNPAFIAAIVRTESHFDPAAQSSMGARGLMQLMEDTASWVYEKIGDTSAYSFDQMYNPETNLRYGCWYISYLSDMFGGDPICVAAAYHTGHNWMKNILNNSAYSSDGRTVSIDKIPDESTRNYATKVLTAYAIYRQKYDL